MTFLSKIETLKPLRKNKKQVAVVANRVRPRSRAGRVLEEFLTNFNHPPLVTLREAAFYVEAADNGFSVFDRADKVARGYQLDWVDLINYLETD